MKKLAALLLSIVFLTPVANVYGVTDDGILLDVPEYTYHGREDGYATVRNLQFTDGGDVPWAAEAIARSGALNLVKGYDSRFYPNNLVSKEEAIAFVMRVMGLEMDSLAAAQAAMAQFPADSPTRSLWSLGYLNLAMQNGLITFIEYNDAISPDQTYVAEAGGFMRGNAATREEIAGWLYNGLLLMDPTIFSNVDSVQSSINFSDWASTDVTKIAAIEALARNGIMVGNGDGTFKPKGNVTRAEMAQILRNMESVYYAAAGLEKKDGVVSAIRDNQYSSVNESALWRNLYVRRADGKVDVLQYQAVGQAGAGINTTATAVVFADGAVTDLSGLKEGSAIQYIVNNTTGEVLYAEVTNQINTTLVTGRLYNIDTAESSITITKSSKNYIYSYRDSLVSDIDGVSHIKMEEKWHSISSLPFGSEFELTLNNNIAVAIKHVGETELIAEVHGVVAENDNDFGVLTIYDDNGVRRNFVYYENDILVKKRMYYDVDDEIGYLDQVFPNFKYNPMDSVITEIEPGDIVFIRPLPGEPNVIQSISAATDYVMRYGKVVRFEEVDGTQMLVEFEDKSSAWYGISGSVFVSKQGKPMNRSAILPGDWVKLLVNQAIVEPGFVIESLKEVSVEGAARYVTTLVKGRLSQVDTIQQKLALTDTYTLGKTGWGGYKNISQFTLGKDMEFYHNDKRVSMDYALRYLKFGDYTVYVAISDAYGGETASKVTFRDERDEMLSPDNVLRTSGDSFNIFGHSGPIETDAGTIVRRYGRLVDGGSVAVPDYATVVLNGAGKAAIVDISEEPATDKLIFARAVVSSVDLGKTFKTQSMALLYGDKFVYTPIQRTYDIDHETVFLTEDGITTASEFMSYQTGASASGNTYNIVADGTHADYVVSAPYAKFSVRGEIVSMSGDVATLRNAYYYDNFYGRWYKVSETNSVITVNMLPNTLIGKNNQIVTPNKLVAGDQIRVLTGALPDRVVTGSEIDAVIVLVEK